MDEQNIWTCAISLFILDQRLNKEPRMDGYEELERILLEEIAKYTASANSPETAPDLFGVEGVEGKRAYYTKYAEGISAGLADCKKAIEAKDIGLLEQANGMINRKQRSLEQRNWDQDIEVSGVAEGLGVVQDRISLVKRSIGFGEDEELASGMKI
jgi:hypothetical protein